MIGPFALSPLATLLLLVHGAATWYLVGLCWLVQRVQYPLMARVGADEFPFFEAGHVGRIGPVVAPMMLLELGTGLALWWTGGELGRQPLFRLGLVLLMMVWLSTFLVQVPLHETLGRGFDAAAHATLVRTNWVRTLAWSVRGLILLWIFGSLLLDRNTASA